MVEKIRNNVAILSRSLDRVAGMLLAAVAILVVVNVVFRALFNSPIMGTYDYVGLLSSVMIGMALAYCAVQEGHIAVTIIVDRFPLKLRAVVELLVNLAGMVFWGLAGWFVMKYASAMMANGNVSSTVQVPMYPFVYAVAFGLFALCVVLFSRVLDLLKKAAFRK